MPRSSRYFDLLSRMDLLTLWSFEVDDTEPLSPQNANPYYIGEYFAFSGGKLVRASTGGPGWVNIAEIGAPDIQLSRKLPLIVAGEFIARTRIHSVALGTAPGTPLEVNAAVSVDGTKSGLQVLDTGVNGDHYQVGVVLATRPLPQNKVELTYIGFAPRLVRV